MSRSVPFWVFIILLAISAAGLPAAEWRHPLYMSGGGVWEKRTAIHFAGDAGLGDASHVIAVPVGIGERQLNLVGVAAREIRVTDAIGRELLYSVENGGVALKDNDLVPAGAILRVPALSLQGRDHCIYVYYGNPAAYPVPDRLSAGQSAVEDSVEKGSGGAPENWVSFGGDGQDGHRNEWCADTARTGKRSLKMSVAAGSQPTWAQFRRTFAVSGGETCRIRMYVKGENIVDGDAGFGVNVISQDQKMLDNHPKVVKSRGSFDWRLVEDEFVIPAGAKELRLMTIMRGTSGVAWFDDISVEIMPKARLDFTLDQEESLHLTTVKRPDVWELRESDWPVRIPLDCRNVTDSNRAAMLFVIPLRAVTRGNYRDSDMCLMFKGVEIPTLRIGGNLVFELRDMGPKSEIQASLYLHRNRQNKMVSGAMKESSIANVNELGKATPTGTLLSDYKFTEADDITPEKFAAFFRSSANLMRGYRFGDDGAWGSGVETGGGLRKQGASYEFASGGAFGEKIARMSVAKDAARGWYGFRQEVPIQSNRCYLLAGWSRSKPNQDGSFEQYNYSGGRLTAHMFRKSQPSQRMYPGTLTPHDGKNIWRLDSTIFREVTGADDMMLQVHLTVDAKGTFEYDGILLAEVTDADAGVWQHAPSAEVHALTLWSQPPVVKLFQDDAPESVPQMFSLHMARNESENLQLGFRAPGSCEFTLRATAPVNAGGSRLEQPTVNVVGYVKVDTDPDYFTVPYFSEFHRLIPPALHYSGCMYPDVLMPTDQVTLRPLTTQSAYIGFKTTRDTTPGVYSGEIELLSGGKVIKAVPYQVHVGNFTLPDAPQLPALFEIREGGYTRMWGPESGDVPRQAICDYLRSRKSSDPYIEGSFHIFSIQNGKVVANFTQYDKAASWYFDQAGFPYAWSPGQLFRNGQGAPFLGIKPFSDTAAESSGTFSEEFKRAYQDALRQFVLHVKEKGWYGRYLYYLMDEPNAMNPKVVKELAGIADLAHEVDPALRTYTSSWSYIPECKAKVNVWGIGMQGSMTPERMAQCQRDGDGLMFTTDGHLVLATPYCASERLLPLLCWKYHVHGYEFWSVDFYTQNPFEWGFHGKDCIAPGVKPVDKVTRWTSGDGYLIYPGNLIGRKGTVVGSIRLDNVRDGVEDYEYYVALEKAVQKTGDKKASQTLEALRHIAGIPNSGGRDSVMLLPDPWKLAQLREEILGHLDRLGSQ